MKLSELLSDFVALQGSPKYEEVEVSTICSTTQDIVDSSVFFALQGIQSHGFDYLNDVDISRLTAIVYEPSKPLPENVKSVNLQKISVEALSEKMSAIASRFYNFPSSRCGVIGITGTNGKTSSTHFIAQLLDGAVIGTMGYGNPKALKRSSHTTPDALTAQRMLHELSDKVDNVSIEVSSHGLSLHRIDGVSFNTVVFTNLTLDHLDFYGNMNDYVLAKKRLFSDFSANFSIINGDDDYAEEFAKASEKNNQHVLWFGKTDRIKAKQSFLHYKKINADQKGIKVELTYDLLGEKGKAIIQMKVWGEFNLSNTCTAILAGLSLGYKLADLIERARELTGVFGRISPLSLPNGATAVIDYAHTPDALQNVLESVREHTGGKVVCLFGCGGDRDTLKRPLMATIAESYADEVIVTDDNPRTENSEQIIADIMSGARLKNKFTSINGRNSAIVEGLRRLNKGDVLIVAGKGHETYQVIGTEVIEFSDYEHVQNWIKDNNGNTTC